MSLSLQPLSLSPGIQSLPGMINIEITSPKPIPRVSVQDGIYFVEALLKLIKDNSDLVAKKRNEGQLEAYKTKLKQFEEIHAKKLFSCLPNSWTESGRALQSQQRSVRFIEEVLKRTAVNEGQTHPKKFQDDTKCSEMFANLKMNFDPQFSNFNELMTKLMLACFANFEHIPVLDKPVRQIRTPSWNQKISYQTPTHLVMKAKVENLDTHSLEDAIMLTTQNCIDVFFASVPRHNLMIKGWKISEGPITQVIPVYFNATHEQSLWMCRATLDRLKKIEDFVNAHKCNTVESRVEVLQRVLTRDTVTIIIQYIGVDELQPGSFLPI